MPTYDAEKAWYLGELGVTNLLNAGITGKGIRVGVIDFGVGDIVTGMHTNVHCAAKGGKDRKAMHGPAVEGIIASDVYGIAPECELYVYDDGDGTASSRLRISHRTIVGRRSLTPNAPRSCARTPPSFSTRTSSGTSSAATTK